MWWGQHSWCRIQGGEQLRAQHCACQHEDDPRLWVRHSWWRDQGGLQHQDRGHEALPGQQQGGRRREPENRGIEKKEKGRMKTYKELHVASAFLPTAGVKPESCSDVWTALASLYTIQSPTLHALLPSPSVPTPGLLSLFHSAIITVLHPHYNPREGLERSKIV